MRRHRVYAVLFACFGFLAVVNAVTGYRAGWSTPAVALTAVGGTVTFLAALATAVRPALLAADRRLAVGGGLVVGVLAFAAGTAISVL